MTTPNKAQADRKMLQDDGRREYICSPTACGYDGKEHCQNCGYHAKLPVWYSCAGSGGQGLVIDENTGRNVAVAYDEADAPLLAAAPELLAVAKSALAHLEAWHSGEFESKKAQAREAIAKAEGRAE